MDQRLRVTILALAITASSAVGVLGFAAPALASPDRIFVVDSTGAGADTDAGDGTCATTGGACTLLAALQEADSTAGTGVVEIDVPAGIHALAGPVTLGRNVAITGAGRDVSVIALGDGVGITVTLAALEVTGVTISGGLAIDGVGGSAIAADGAALTITASRLEDNRSDGDGGAVQVVGGSLTVNDSQFRTNVGQIGGAITTSLSAVAIADSSFTGNSSSAGGGAIAISYPTSITITDTTFSDNTTVLRGGAVSVHGFTGSAPAPMAITGSTFSDNLAGSDGGALFVGRLASSLIDVPLVLSGSTFSDNSAQVGGAVAIDFGEVRVSDSTFTDNRAAEGAGGAMASGGVLAVAGSTFIGNSAAEAGGAIASNGPTAIIGSTFNTNVAGTLGGALDLFAPQTPVVTGTTFRDNVAGVGAGAIWRLGDELDDSANTFSGNDPEGDDVRVGPAPSSSRQNPGPSTPTGIPIPLGPWVPLGSGLGIVVLAFLWRSRAGKVR